MVSSLLQVWFKNRRAKARQVHKSEEKKQNEAASPQGAKTASNSTEKTENAAKKNSGTPSKKSPTLPSTMNVKSEPTSENSLTSLRKMTSSLPATDYALTSLSSSNNNNSAGKRSPFASGEPSTEVGLVQPSDAGFHPIKSPANLSTTSSQNDEQCANTPSPHSSFPSPVAMWPMGVPPRGADPSPFAANAYSNHAMNGQYSSSAAAAFNMYGSGAQFSQYYSNPMVDPYSANSMSSYSQANPYLFPPYPATSQHADTGANNSLLANHATSASSHLPSAGMTSFGQAYSRESTPVSVENDAYQTSGQNNI